MFPADRKTTLDCVLLAELPDGIRDLLFRNAQIQVLPRDVVLFEQDDYPEVVFIILKGWVKLCRVLPNGTEVVIDVLSAGRSLGELSAIQCLPHVTTARTATKARLLRIRSGTMRRAVETDPAFMCSILRAAFDHFHGLIYQIEALKSRSSVQRLALFLLSHADKNNGKCARFTLPYSKSLIAAELGMKPETLSRTILRLREHGVLIKATMVHIENLDSLRKIIAEDTNTIENSLFRQRPKLQFRKAIQARKFSPRERITTLSIGGTINSPSSASFPLRYQKPERHRSKSK